MKRVRGGLESLVGDNKCCMKVGENIEGDGVDDVDKDGVV